MTRVSLPVLSLAVETAYAYVCLSPGVRVLEAVDVTCDHQGIFDDRDRRVVRNVVERRVDKTLEERRSA